MIQVFEKDTIIFGNKRLVETMMDISVNRCTLFGVYLITFYCNALNK